MKALPQIIPISDLRKEAAGIVRRVSGSSDPIVITQRGKAAVVMVGAEAYRRSQEELEILKILVQGDKEIAAGAGFSMEEVMKEADAILEA
ncbi:MAG: prevent-host-death family protein [Rhodothermales bacterium]|jgi:prevent-host-death family protein